MSRARSKKRESSLGDRLSGEGLQRSSKAELVRKLNGFHEILKDLGQVGAHWHSAFCCSCRS
jgi:hypothetical protein